MLSLPLYGRLRLGGGVLDHATEFHLLPILAVAYLVAQSGAISPLVAGAVCLAGTGLLFVDLDDLTLAPGFGWSQVLFALLAIWSAASAGVFTVIVSLILFGSFLGERKESPVDVQRIAVLKAKLVETPEDEKVKQQIEELLRDKVTPETLTTATKFIKLLWGERAHENLMKSINPLGQLEISMDNGRGGKETRYLQFDFHRVMGQKGVKHVLCSVGDITSSVLLAAAARGLCRPAPKSPKSAAGSSSVSTNVSFGSAGPCTDGSRKGRRTLSGRRQRPHRAVMTGVPRESGAAPSPSPEGRRSLLLLCASPRAPRSTDHRCTSPHRRRSARR